MDLVFSWIFTSWIALRRAGIRVDRCRRCAGCAPTSPPDAPPPVIVWFRVGDLRLRDNPALHAAAESQMPVLPVYVTPSDAEEGGWPLKGAARFAAARILGW